MPYNGQLSIAIYDDTGQIVRTVFEGRPTQAGVVDVNWDGRDDYGNVVPSGSFGWKALASRATATDEGSVGQAVTGWYLSPEGVYRLHGASVNSVAIDRAGNTYEASYYEEIRPTVLSWDPAGNIRWAFNAAGPAAMAVDDTYVYLARDAHDGPPGAKDNRVERYPLNAPVAERNRPPTPWEASPYIQANPDKSGNGVYGLAVDANYLWVSNYKRNLVQIYQKNDGGDAGTARSGSLVTEFAVNAPRGIAADGAGRAWVSTDEGRVIRCDVNGTTSTAISNLDRPFTLSFVDDGAHAGNGTLYVGEATGWVKKFDAATQARIGGDLFGPAVPGPVSDTKLLWPAQWGSNETRFVPGGLAADAAGNILIADMGNRRVQLHRADGTVTTHRSEFVPAPQVTASIDPNLLLSGNFEYAVDYSTGGTHGNWSLVNNWMPSDGKLYSNMGFRRKLGGKDYMFYLGTMGGGATPDDPGGYNVGATIYEIGPNGVGLRRSVRVSASCQYCNDPLPTDPALYVETDNNRDGVFGVGERTRFDGFTFSVNLGPGWYVDEAGNLWIANWNYGSGATLQIPFEGIDTKGNPIYNWDHKKIVVPKDDTPWDFRTTNVVVDPAGTLYRLGTTAQAPTPAIYAAWWPNGTTVERRTPDGKRVVFPNSDFIGAVAGGDDGQHFYTVHSACTTLRKNMFVKMFTNDGLRVAIGTNEADPMGPAGCIDHGMALTAFRHSGNASTPPTHYIYAEDDYLGRSIRWRVDALDSVQRLNPVPAGSPPTDATPFVWSECDPAKPFGGPVPVPGRINTKHREGVPRVTADEKVLYFDSDQRHPGDVEMLVSKRATLREGFAVATDDVLASDSGNNPSLSADGKVLYYSSVPGVNHVMFSTRASLDAKFVDETIVPALNSNAIDGQPFFREGADIWFISMRPGGAGGGDIYWAPFGGSPGAFGTPALVSELNSSADEWLPTVSADGRTIYFATKRDGAGGSKPDFDIWTATRPAASGAFEHVAPLANVNSTSDDTPGSLSPDQCHLYMSSANDQSQDVFMAKRPSTARCDVTQPFASPVKLAGAINSEYYEGVPRLTPDERTLYLDANRPEVPGSGTRMLFGIRLTVDADIGPPHAALLFPSLEAGVPPSNIGNNPSMSHDGKALYYTSVPGLNHIMVSTRTTDTSRWFLDGTIVAALNSNQGDGQPFIRDGAEIWFVSKRGTGNGDIYVAPAGDDPTSFGAPRAISELNSPAEEWFPVVSPDGLTIFFASRRDGAGGSKADFDIWTATRPTRNDAFTNVAKLGIVSSEGADEYPGWITADGCQLYFSSSRDGGHDVFVATRPR